MLGKGKPFPAPNTHCCPGVSQKWSEKDGGVWVDCNKNIHAICGVALPHPKKETHSRLCFDCASKIPASDFARAHLTIATDIEEEACVEEDDLGDDKKFPTPFCMGYDDDGDLRVRFRGKKLFIVLGSDASGSKKVPHKMRLCRFRNGRVKQGETKCNFGGRYDVHLGFYRCTNKACKGPGGGAKTVHLKCFFQFIENEKDGKHLISGDKVMLVCSRKCYKVVDESLKKVKVVPARATSKSPTPPHWANDGLDGKPSSEQILVEWLSDQRNIERYLGAENSSGNESFFGGDGGKSKIGICLEISEYIKKTQWNR